MSTTSRDDYIDHTIDYATTSRDDRIQKAIDLELEARTLRNRTRTRTIGRRLADIGLKYDRLVGSVADELGLPLASIYTSIDILADREAAEDTIRKAMP